MRTFFFTLAAVVVALTAEPALALKVEGQVKGFDAYAKGKTLAEKAAWDYLKNLSEEQHKPELVTILPGFAVGSYITGGIASSPALIKALLVNSLAGIPRLSFACVDI